jgi:hypothetical protein
MLVLDDESELFLFVGSECGVRGSGWKQSSDGVTGTEGRCLAFLLPTTVDAPCG